MFTDDIAVVREALWVARDRSVLANGVVPQIVTDAPAALGRIEREYEGAMKAVRLKGETVREAQDAVAGLRARLVEAERTIDAVRDALTTADLDSDLARLTAASAFVNAYLASREQEGSVNAEVSSNHHLTSNQSKPNSPST